MEKLSWGPQVTDNISFPECSFWLCQSILSLMPSLKLIIYFYLLCGKYLINVYWIQAVPYNICFLFTCLPQGIFISMFLYVVGTSLRRSSSKVLFELWETKETFQKLGLGSEILFPRSARALSLGICWPHHNIHLLHLAVDLSVGQEIIIFRVLSER